MNPKKSKKIETINAEKIVPNSKNNFQSIQNSIKLPENVSRKKRISRFSKIGFAFLTVGFSSLSASLYYKSDILVFIGLGLTLWGGLFFFIKPARYIEANILSSTVVSSLVTLDKILNELNYRGKGIYLPPKCFENLEAGIVFIPSKESNQTPNLEMIKTIKEFSRSDGLCIISPGQGLFAYYENKLRTKLNDVGLDYLLNNLPKLLVEDMGLIQKIEIKPQNDMISVKLFGSIFKSLYNDECTFIACRHVGCPLSSSIAVALAKITDSAVIIEDYAISKRGNIVEIKYRIMKD